MKKLITILATVVLMAGSVTSAVTAIDQNNKIPAPYIGPGKPTKGQQEANQINYDLVKLNDTVSKSYLNTTAQQDKTVIEQQLEANKQLDPKTAGDFTFDNTTPLQWYVKNRISYHVQASDGTKGNGVLDIYVNPYTPGPTPHKKASKLTPSNPKASIIGPSKKKKEDAEDIANKLFNKSIKLDPNFWLNTDIKADPTDLNKALIKDGLLTANETQYVKWGSLNINKAGYFWNKAAFSVKKDGATATGTATVDADSGSTTQQIANKINKATNIKFNYNYWNNKAVQNELPVLRTILVNDKILTRPEASVVTGLVSPVTITKTGAVTLNVDVNDNNTNTDANANVNVLNDGASANQIAGGINNDSLGLKTNTSSMYADTNYVTNNVRNILVNYYQQTTANMNDVTLPHTLLKNDTPVNAIVTKDGQIANAKLNLQSKTTPYIYYGQATLNDLVFYVNLNPAMTNTLKGIFSHYNAQHDLGVFYNALDNGQVHGHRMPTYSGPSYILSADRLDQNLHEFGAGITPNYDIRTEAINNLPAIQKFANTLYQQIMHSNGYLSLMVHWHYTIGKENTISGYHFW